MIRIWVGILLGGFCWGAWAESGGNLSARGGAFVQVHTTSLASFDPELGGNPIVIGGEGFAAIGKGFRIGGGGGAGFVWSPTDATQFSLGYGGLIGEYQFFSWLSARLLLGGGGYGVAKTVVDSSAQTTDAKIASGGFLLILPSIGADVALNNAMRLGVRVGYFMPNVSNLQGLLVAIHLTFGKS